MKHIKTFSHGLLLTSLIVSGLSPLLATATALPVAPTPALPASLSLAQLKITGDEFVIVQNNSANDITDLSQYTLKSFNNVDPLASGATSATQQLPATNLGAGQRLLLSTAVRSTCGASLAGKLNLSLTDGGGFLEILQTNSTAPPLVVDSVSWSSSTVGVIQNLRSSAKDPQGLYYRVASGSGFSWQPADQDTGNSCQLSIMVTTAGATTKLLVANTSLVTAVDSAPATIVVASADPDTDPAAPNLPLGDSGLTVPEITELLPNPAGSGNDARDEFIELYNPNDSAFDLSGFKLQTGITSVHVYTFSSGASLPAKSFTSFTSAMTGLSLSNNGSRAQLLDPSGFVLVTTPAYGTASDGLAWGLANGHWYWSLTPTPGAANVITLPAPVTKTTLSSANAAALTSKSTKSNPSVKTSKAVTGATAKTSKVPKVVAPKTPKQKKPVTKTIATTPTAAAVTARPVQAKVVALVAGLAVLYGVYEYRADLANGFFKLRSKFGAGRPDRR